MTVTTTAEHVVDIDASPDTVYRLWTTGAGLSAWWGRQAEIDARPGGAIRVDIDGTHVMAGEIVRLDPPTALEFTFGWEGGDVPPGATNVEVAIAERPGGCIVTLRHHGLPVEFVEPHASGWTHFLGERLATEAVAMETP
jgi:uncharacterized protein YndB with AHSA1/START domain